MGIMDTWNWLWVQTMLASSQNEGGFFMLYNVVVDERGGTTYVPTALGNVLLGAVIIALLAAAVVFAKMHAKKLGEDREPGRNGAGGGRMTIKQLVFCAMAVALGTVLSNIKLFDLPYGGSVTMLSMLVICLPGYFFGCGAGLMTGLAYGVLQLLIDPYILFPAQLVMDYLLAFGALGLSGLFSGAKNGLVKGYVAAVLGRYVFVVLSGCIFFASYAWEGWGVLPYSLAYNGSYIFSEAAISIVIILLPPVKSAVGRIRKLALE